MDNIKELMFSVMGAFLFCAAITLFLSFTGKVGDMTESVRSMENIDTSIASVTAREYGEPEVTYEDVVAEFFTDSLQYDIVIDGTLYRKSEYNLARYDVSGIRETSTYRRSCIYDDNGILTTVVYWSN